MTAAVHPIPAPSEASDLMCAVPVILMTNLRLIKWSAGSRGLPIAPNVGDDESACHS